LDGGERRLELVRHDGREVLAQHLTFPAQRGGFLHQMPPVQSAPDDQPELLRGERFGHEIERASLHGLYGRAQRCVSGDHDRHDGRIKRANPFDDLHA
jgi:hypothetical protein